MEYGLLNVPRATAVPGRGTRLAFRAGVAAAAYEFRMQVRRRSVWLVLGLLGAYMLRLLTSGQLQVGETASYEVASWAWLLQVLMPVAVGVLLADRLVRDARLRVDEILDTSPAPFAARFLGKFLGATAATLMPMLLTYALGLAWLVSRGLDPAAVLVAAVPAFVVIDLPGLLFIAAFSVATPLIMPAPVYQFLYVGYWFWGNLMPPQVMPTLRDTWLAPIGWSAGRAFFGLFEEQYGRPSPFDGLMSISILLAGAAAALAAGLIVVRYRRARA